jgi:hypothetical protein
VWTTDNQWNGAQEQPTPNPSQGVPVKPTETPEFKNWFGKSKVVNAAGEPQVVYHGTTHAFDTFTPERGNPENAYGKGYYFSDNPEDASANYAGEGPDLTSRIENLAERLADDEHMTHDEAIAEAKKQLSGGKPNVMPTYIKMENPVVISPKGGTHFEIDTDEDGNESGNGVDLYNAVQHVANTYENQDGSAFDGQQAWNYAMEHIGDSTFSAHKFEQAFREALSEQDIYDSGDALNQVFQAMGFDGIKQDAWHEFGKGSPKHAKYGGGMSNMKPGTHHYIVFDPTHIKSATGNSGKYSPTNPNITSKNEQPNQNVVA